MEAHDNPTNRARRRLLKLTAYVPPMILSLKAERAHAGRAAPTAAAKAGTAIATHAAAKVQAKVGG